MTRSGDIQNSEPPSFPLWQRAALFCSAYFLCALAGSLLSVQDNTTYVTFWLPAGLFAAVLLLNPTCDWPVLCLSVLPANVAFDYVHDPHPYLPVVLLFYLANVTQAIGGAWLVRRFVAERPALLTIKEFVGLVGFAGVLSTMAGAAIGAGALSMFGLTDNVFQTWKVWWGSCGMAVLVLAPPILVYCASENRPAARVFSVRRTPELVLIYGGMAVFLWCVIARGGGINSPKVPALVFILLAGLRFGLRGAAAGVLLLAIESAYLTTHYLKGLSAADLDSGDYVFILQVFVAVAALVGFVPSIVLGERDRTTAKLRDSEARFRTLTEAAFEGIFISENGRIWDVSDQGLTMFGYERKEMIGKPIMDLVAPDSRALVKRAVESNEDSIYGHALLRKDGTSFFAEARTKLVRIGDRTLRMTALRDITDRRRTEQALRESEDKFSRAFRTSPDVMSITDLETGRYIEVNDAHERVFGFKRESVIGRSPLELGILADPSVRETMSRALREAGSVRNLELEAVTQDGRRLTVLHSAELITLGGRACALRVSHDITERKRTEQALRESEEKFSKAFRASPDGLSITDLETGRFVEVNDGYCKLYGYARADVLGRNSIELGIWQNSEDRNRLVEALKSQGTVRDLQVRTRTRTGGIKIIHLSAEPIELDGKRRVVSVLHDVTDRIQAEESNRSQREVLEMIASGQPMSATLDVLLRMVEAQSSDMLCSVLLLDADKVHMRHGAAPSLPAEYARAVDGAAIGPTAGSCGTAAYRGEPVFVADIATDPLWADYKGLALRHGLQACWSTPIFDAHRKVLGTFAVYHRQPGLPGERHRQLISMVTHTAAICISRHRAEAERDVAMAREQQARVEYTLQLIASQEAERKRIAAELHDSMGQNLLLIKNLAEMALRAHVPEQAYEHLGTINHLAVQCIAEARQISRDLHPYQLDHLGLKRALEAMLEHTAQASRIQFDSKFEPVDELFSSDSAMNLYRIVQESLNNILKHSQASRVTVQLERDIHEVLLRIEDDGVGFDLEKAGTAKGLGLKNITERVRMLNGKLSVISSPGQGTRLAVAIPMAEK